MSLFSWLFSADKPSRAVTDSSELSRLDATRQAARRSTAREDAGGTAQPGSRKGERMARRELLYSAVREAMTRAGVLSASYKFKVLSLDARGRQFLVMVDLAPDQGGETARLAEIETLIAQGARARHDIEVSAVYWRTNEPVAAGDLSARHKQRPGNSAGLAPDSRPAALDSRPAVLDPGPAPLARASLTPTGSSAPSRYDPIQPDEVAAFRNALAAGAAVPVAAASAAADVPQGARARAFDGSSRHGPQSYTLLTGFEDTELPDADMRTPSLSGTQYGDLN